MGESIKNFVGQKSQENMKREGQRSMGLWNLHFNVGEEEDSMERLKEKVTWFELVLVVHFV